MIMKILFTFLTSIYSLFAFTQTFSGGNGLISDNQTIDIPIVVSGLSPSTIDTATFGLETICLNLTHTWDADLTVSIVSPDGTSTTLFSGVGGDGDNFQNTCLDWISSTTLSSSTAPFTGNFKSPGQFGIVNNGQNPNGTWFLRIQDGYTGDEGNIIDWSLTFGSNPAKYFDFKSSNLPIVIINANGQQILDDPKIVADMGIIFNGIGIRNNLTDNKNEYNGKIGIEIRGNYSASLPQKPYAFELIDNLNNSIDSSLLGMPAEHDWLLLANYNDKSFARNEIPYHLFGEMGHYSTKCRLVDVVVNNQYQGIYLLCEQIKRDANRVNISKLDSTEIQGINSTGGYIVKVDYWDNSNSWQSNYSPITNPGLDIHFVYYYPKPDVIVQQQKDYIQNYFNDFETALYGTNFNDPINGYRKYIGTSSFIDYFLINELTRNNDGFKKSRYLYKDKDHLDGTFDKLKAGPVWDFDWAQKDSDGSLIDGSQFMYGNVNEDVHAPGWYIRLLQDTLFANELKCRYNELRQTIFSLNYIHSKIDSIATTVQESQNWHFQTWGNLGIATGSPEVQAPSQTYAEEIQKLKDWYTRRINWLDNNIPGNLYCSFANLNELNKDEFTIYPNPFSSSLTIQFTSSQNELYTIELIDQYGRVLKKEEFKPTNIGNQSYSLNQLNLLTKGVYFVRLSNSSSKIIKKVMN